jgi:hypothetical protein
VHVVVAATEVACVVMGKRRWRWDGEVGINPALQIPRSPDGLASPPAHAGVQAKGLGAACTCMRGSACVEVRVGVGVGMDVRVRVRWDLRLVGPVILRLRTQPGGG